MRNEIYARYGRPFQTPAVQNHFSSQGWYRVNPNYYDGLLTGLEASNARTISGYEAQSGCL